MTEAKRQAARAGTMLRRAFTLLELLVVISIIVVLVGIVLAVGTALGSATEKTQTETTLQVLETALSEWENKSGRALTWGMDGQLPNGNSLTRAKYDMQSFISGSEDPSNYGGLQLPIFLITEMLGTVARSSDIRELLTQIDDDHLVNYNSARQPPEWIRAGNLNPDPYVEPDLNRGSWNASYTNGDWDGGLTVLDAWDRPIRVVHPGRKWTATDVLGGGANPPVPADPDGTVRTLYENVYGVCVSGRPFFVSSGPDRSFGDLSGTGVAIDAAKDNLYSYEVDKP